MAGTSVLLPDGSTSPIESLRVGDRVVSIHSDGAHLSYATVTWKSDCIRKRCKRIDTRLGHSVVAALDHPIRTWNEWTPTLGLVVGDRVATVRRSGEFSGAWKDIHDNLIAYVAYMIGDGYCGGLGKLSYTQDISSPGYTDFLRIANEMGWSYKTYQKKGSKAAAVHIGRKPEEPTSILERSGLFGKKSDSKFIPKWVFGLTSEQTALFINRLWSTDGCVIQRPNTGQVDIFYATISFQLARDVQSILWKFGIPSRISSEWPKIFRDRGEKRMAYKVRVETRDGLYTFLYKIGALGKSEGIELSESEENNNRDTFPIEIYGDIRRIQDSSGYPRQRGRNCPDSLHARGVHVTGSYPPTMVKIKSAVSFFRSDPRFDIRLTDDLSDHITTDLYWDRVTAIRDEGERDCYDITVEGTESFIAEGVVVHNSTAMANIIASTMYTQPYSQSMYINCRENQVQDFARLRLLPVLNSPDIHKDLFGKSKRMQGDGSVTERELNRYNIRALNGSICMLRWANMSADRIRGTSAEKLFFDETQDIPNDSFAVIYESQEAVGSGNLKDLSLLETWLMGTPKTFDNYLEEQWKLSTQVEWSTRCEACGKYNIALDTSNIGPMGVICNRCKRGIDPTRGELVALQPGRNTFGFHFNALMRRHNQCQCATQHVTRCKWHGEQGILWKYKNYSERQFANEVLGLSFDASDHVFLEHEVLSLCDESRPNWPRWHDGIKSPLCAGIDWASGGTAKTVLVIGYMTPDNEGLHVVYARKWDSRPEDQLDEVREIASVIGAWRVQVVACDQGDGHLRNSELQRVLGDRIPVVGCTYQGTEIESAPTVRKNKKSRVLTLQRTKSIDQIRIKIRHQQVSFFRRSEFMPYWEDMKYVYEDENSKTKRRYYDHPSTKPDDFLHSLVYLHVALCRQHGRVHQGVYA